MRLMSFALTTEQIRNRTKTVTRRLGWKTLKPGTLLCAVVKGQGLKKGESPVRLGVIRVTDVRREWLDAMEQGEPKLEGFPDMTPDDFVRMFMKHMGVFRDAVVTRIEFEYFD
jgi:hypothetical protein